MKDYLQRALLNVVSTLARASSKIYVPFSRKLIKAAHYHAIRYKIRAGTILLSRVEGEFSGLVIPGFWTHVGIVADNLTVIEAATHGVVKTDLIDFMMKKDHVCALDPLFADQDQMVTAMMKAEQQIGKPYDFSMNQSDIKSFYCSELVYFAYREAVNQSPFTLRSTLGRLTVTPQDFADAKKKFKQVWHSDELDLK